MIRPLLSVLLALPLPALAVGPEDPPEPPPSLSCPNGQIWAAPAARCSPIRAGLIPPETQHDVAQALADAGRFDDAIALIETGPRPFDSPGLTLLGYAHRQAGRREIGLAFYRQALTLDPDNLRARSYLGRAHLLAGDRALAEAELAEIRARGGRGTWPERALAAALSAEDPDDY